MLQQTLCSLVECTAVDKVQHDQRPSNPPVEVVNRVETDRTELWLNTVDRESERVSLVKPCQGPNCAATDHESTQSERFSSFQMSMFDLERCWRRECRRYAQFGSSAIGSRSSGSYRVLPGTDQWILEESYAKKMSRGVGCQDVRRLSEPKRVGDESGRETTTSDQDKSRQGRGRKRVVVRNEWWCSSSKLVGGLTQPGSQVCYRRRNCTVKSIKE